MEEVSQTYFHGIPQDVQSRILGFTDIRNQRALQHARRCCRADFLHRECTRASLFFSTHSPFHGVAVTIFSVLILGDRTSMFELCARRRIVKVSPELFEDENKISETIMLKTLGACGGSVRKVVFRNVKDNMESHACLHHIAKIVARHCTNVEHLVLNTFSSLPSMRDTCAILMRAFAQNLMTLSMNSFDNMAPLDFPRCKSLKSLQYEGNDFATLATLLKANGRTLEEVNISVLENALKYDELLDVIGENCECLKILSLDSRAVVGALGEESYEAFLLSVGEQLERTSASGLSAARLRRVAEACPNARFSWYGSCDYETWDGINVLGTQLDFLDLDSLTWLHVRDWERYSNSLVTCTHLRILHISTSSHYDGHGREDIAALKNMFRWPLYSLEVVVLRDVSFTCEVAAQMARSTSNIRELIVEPNRHSETGIEFEDLFNSNPLLQNVKLAVNLFPQTGATTATQEVIYKLLMTFTNSRHLQMLLLDIRNCVPCGIDRYTIRRKCCLLLDRDTEIKVWCANQLLFEWD